jgi:hypothetical protein
MRPICGWGVLSSPNCRSFARGGSRSPLFRRATLDTLIQSLQELHNDCLADEVCLQEEIDGVAPEYRASARNLVHYLALRQHDVRELQRELSRLGLSSLGRLEGHTLAAIDAVLVAPHKLHGGLHAFQEGEPPVDNESGSKYWGDTLALVRRRAGCEAGRFAWRATGGS